MGIINPFRSYWSTIVLSLPTPSQQSSPSSFLVQPRPKYLKFNICSGATECPCTILFPEIQFLSLAARGFSINVSSKNCLCPNLQTGPPNREGRHHPFNTSTTSLPLALSFPWRERLRSLLFFHNAHEVLRPAKFRATASCVNAVDAPSCNEPVYVTAVTTSLTDRAATKSNYSSIPNRRPDETHKRKNSSSISLQKTFLGPPNLFKSEPWRAVQRKRSTSEAIRIHFLWKGQKPNSFLVKIRLKETLHRSL